jgi:hypothetical protein
LTGEIINRTSKFPGAIREEVIKSMRFINFIVFCPRPVKTIRNAAEDITF